jgi:dTDP-4-amino-4,6-dideoxygalactose transaminase/SAM-dependent methyltransferase
MGAARRSWDKLISNQKDYLDRLFASEENHWWFKSRRRIIRGVIRPLIKRRDDLLIDVGCGAGGLLLEMKEEAKVMGFDISGKAVSACRRRGLSDVMLGEANQIPLADGSASIVVAGDVLEHLTDDAGALNEAWRVLRPGGHVVVTVPAYDWLKSTYDEFCGHLRRYRAGELAALMTDCGFDVVKTSYFNTLLFPLAAAGRVAGRLIKSSSGDDLKAPPGPVNWLFERVFGLEEHLLKATPLPFGLSVLCVGVKSRPKAFPVSQAIAGPPAQEFITFGSPKIEQAEIDEVTECLNSGWLSTGPKVSKFEEAFSSYTKSKHALAVNSCTAGLHLSLLAAGVERGDEVITTPLTFAATANVIVHVGAKPVFVDIDRVTMNIDPAKISQAITARTKAIIPVHFAGRPCDMEAILTVAREHGLKVIGDAAHATEGRYRGRHVGSIGDLAAFSFYVTKNLVTGEGGMVVTDNDLWAEKIKSYALHGLTRGAWHRYSDKGYKHYQVIYPGYKYNMMDIQAALGIHQLGRVEQYLKRRRQIWDAYDQAFAELPVTTPAKAAAGTRHARHLYTLLIDPRAAGISRDDLQQQLHEAGIGTGVHFTALHLHPYYAGTFGFERGLLPEAEFVGDRTISLPLSAKLTDAAVERIIAEVKLAVAAGSTKQLWAVGD